MFLNNYEVVYILRSDVSEDINLSLINLCKSLIAKQGGKNIYVQHRGRRHLAYKIKNHYDGIYMQINYEGNGKIVRLLEKTLKFNENVIRYLTIKSDPLNSI